MNTFPALTPAALRRAIVAASLLAALAPVRTVLAASPFQAKADQDVTPEELAHRGAVQMLDAAARQARTSGEVTNRKATVTPARTSPVDKMGSPGFVCLPSCDATDGKFLAIASGAGLVTLSDTTLDISIAVPAGVSSFELGFFDGDGAELDAVGDSRWDVGTPARFRYTLFADPAVDGADTTPLPGFPVLSDTMPNNDWVDFTVATGPEAQTPSGNYFYHLQIDMLDVGVTMINLFKIRSSGLVSIELFSQPFSYMTNITSLTDVEVLFPNAIASGFTDASCVPSPLGSCYDGVYRFFFEVAETGSSISVWDGDLDRGNYDGTLQDTDDFNTVGQPTFATVDTRDEGVATGLHSTTGNPPDNYDPSGFGIFFSKPPTVRYDLILPDGQVFANDNPSGNQEWENFVISTDPFDPAIMDYSTSTLPTGIYEMRIEGVDNSNLNSVMIPFRVICVDSLGALCTPIRPYLVGDTVFLDLDRNGEQDGGESGIEGVVVDLLNPTGSTLASTTTDSSGEYSFPRSTPVPTSVLVTPENFLPGGALEGLLSTGSGEEATGVVETDNRLDFDFGYASAPGSLGDRVWLDTNGNGLQDDGPTGLNGVLVTLVGSAGVKDVTVTSGDGDYSFEDLAAGTYQVRVEVESLPVGLAATFDADGLAVANAATVDLTAGEDNFDVDFGYGLCGPCAGKITDLTLHYLGDSAADVQVVAKRGPKSDIVFDGTLQPGEVFSITGPESGNHGFFGTLGTEIRFYVDGRKHTSMHTSCSVPIGPGTVSGDFGVLAGASRHGGLLCPL